jgi:filamentous hemagglutinin family protein
MLDASYCRSLSSSPKMTKPYWLYLTGGLLLLELLNPQQNLAQITSDSTLSSTVTTSDNLNFEIQNGDRVGNNLFHSFNQFSVPTGGSAIFQNAPDIVNIFNRVTGGNPSLIDGLIRADGNANLFLINPSGIVFGANAQLDIGGSFLATTADRLKFADNVEFSALDTTPNPLLTVSVPVGLQLGANPAAIAIQSSNFGLRPGLGGSLLLVGGEMQFDGGEIEARGGRVDLASLAGAGTIGLTSEAQFFRLTVPDGIARNNIFMTRQSLIDVGDILGGNISVYAQDLSLSTGSYLLSSVADMGSLTTRSGDINVNATGTIRLEDNSGIFNELYRNSRGNVGDINIVTGSLVGMNQGAIGNDSKGEGQGGKIRIQARDAIRFEGEGSGIFSGLSSGAIGQGGEINMTTGTLSLINGSSISSSMSQSQGRPGDINIRASGAVSLLGNDRTSSYITSEVYYDGRGNGGNINISAASLSLVYSELLAGLYDGSQGNAGNINVQTTGAIEVRGVSPAGAGGVFSDVYAQPTSSPAVGNGGNIRFVAGSLSLLEGGSLFSKTRSQGNAGSIDLEVAGRINIDGVGGDDEYSSGVYSGVGNRGRGNSGDIRITTGSLALTNSGAISSSTNGQGNAGNVTIAARGAVSIDGSNAGQLSEITSQVNTTGIGNGGNLAISAGSLALTNGGALIVNTNGRGNAGNINLQTTGAISLSGISAEGIPSAIRGEVGLNGIGDGQDIEIRSRSLSVSNGALLSASTQGQGNGGSINVNARNVELRAGGQVFTTSSSSGRAGEITVNAPGSLLLTGSDLSYSQRLNTFSTQAVSAIGSASGLYANTRPGSSGAGGSIQINTGQMNVEQNAQVSVSSQGSGNAGSLNLVADDLTLNQGQLRIESEGQANAGRLELTADTVRLRQQSLINASSNSGQGGDIRFQLRGQLQLDDRSQISVNAQGEGSGGTLRITATGIQLNDRSLLNASSASGQGGGLRFQLSEDLRLDQGSQILSNAQGAGNGGNISLMGRSLQLDQQSLISASSVSGAGGNINFNLQDDLMVQRSQILAGATGAGDGGNIAITADAIDFSNQGRISTTAFGNGGNINLRAREQLNLRSRSQILAATQGTGNGGNITLRTPSLTAQRSDVIVSSQGTGNAGSLTVNTDRLALNQGASFQAEAIAAQGGRITLNAENISLNQSSAITSTVRGTATGGVLTINSDLLQVAQGSRITAATDGTGNAGDIRIQARDAIEVSGQDGRNLSTLSAGVQPNGTGNGGNLRIQTRNLRVTDGGQISGSTSGAGAGGNVNISARESVMMSGGSRISSASLTDAAAGSVQIITPSMTVQDRAIVSVSGNGSGGAGNLEISAAQVRLDNQASLQAEVAGGSQGALSLNADRIFMTRGSTITSNATGRATGGNININSRYLLGFTNSDIVARAEQGQGGRIAIVADGIFGLEFRPELTPYNDISASSENGLDGTVSIIALENDLIELPTDVIDSSHQITNRCAVAQTNQFIITGRGGLPSNPAQDPGDRPWADLRELSHWQEQTSIATNPMPIAADPLTEATAWVMTAQGKIALVANEDLSQIPTVDPTTCTRHS